MIIRRFGSAALAIILVLPIACSRSTSNKEDGRETRLALSEQFLAASGISERRRTAIARAVPQTQDGSERAKEYWRQLTQEEIKIYADLFTADELRGLIAFYESPTGKAFRAKQPQIAERWEKMPDDKLRELLQSR